MAEDITHHFINTRMNKANLQAVYDLIDKYPRISIAAVGQATGLGPNAKKYIYALRSEHLIDNNNVVRSAELDYLANIKLPRWLYEKNYAGGRITRLAYLLGRHSDLEVIPGFNMTKAKLIMKFIDNLDTIHDTQLPMQEMVAIGSITKNNFFCFTDMIDVPPTSIDEWPEFNE